MGGLIILKGLVDEMSCQRAQNMPSNAVSWISLFASPVSGVSSAAIIKNTFGRLRLLGKLMNKQLRDLARGTHCDHLLDQTHRRIYSPNNEDSSARMIPIRMILGTKDSAVDEPDRINTLARYSKLTPIQLNETHKTIKSPIDCYDLRYRALVDDIQEGLSYSFHELCKKCKDSNKNIRNSAWLDLYERYGSMIDSRIIDLIKESNLRDQATTLCLYFIVEDGSARRRPPFDTIIRSAQIVKRKLLHKL